MGWLEFISGLFALLGVLFCALPLIPGPFLSYIALLFLSAAAEWQLYTAWFLISLGVLAVLASAAAYVIPVVAARDAAVSRTGSVFAIIGAAAGFFIYPSIGIILGTSAGAFLGEAMNSPARKKPFGTGWRLFWASVLTSVLKVGYSGYIVWIIARAVT